MICIIDWNKGQNDGYSKDFSIMYDNLQERISSFGWSCKVIDGHNMDTIRYEMREIGNVKHHQPQCIILDTIKGKGVSFMENKVEWHHKAPKPDQFKKALQEYE